VLRKAGGAGTFHGLDEGVGKPDARVQLAGGEQSGVAGAPARCAKTSGVPKKSRTRGQAAGILIH
jgi:hypothetical protein